MLQPFGAKGLGGDAATNSGRVKGMRFSITSMCSISVIIVVVLCSYSPAEGSCPQGDIYPDCRVDWLDVQFFAEHWLEPVGSPADVVGNDGVNFADLAKIAEHWLQTGTGTGLVVVWIAPEGAIEAGAMWRLDGGDWLASGSAANVAAGLHTVEFMGVEGWNEPAPESVRVSGGLTTSIERSYVQQTGSIRVRILPDGAVTLGARWRVAGDVWRSSGQVVGALPVGTYRVEFEPIPDWMTPAAQDVDVSDALTTDIKVRYRHPIVINELMASNAGSAFDPQGEDDDWIELYNASSGAFDVGGMYLTDRAADPTKWRIPLGNPALTTIQPGGYLLIWADGDVEDYPDGLHASFRLDASGEDLGLYDASGVILIDRIDFPALDPNVSFGRSPDGNDTWQLFAFASPGSANVATCEGFVSDVEFSLKRGFYDRPFQLTLACETDGAQIYYTLDGNEPGIWCGRSRTGVRYTTPLFIDRTTCIRARAVKRGWKSSEVDAQTYIFIDDVLTQPANPPGWPTTWWDSTSGDYEIDPEIANDHADSIRQGLKSLPVMSLVMELDDLFGSDGIYSNWSNKGVAWERPVSVEYFTPDGSEQFHVNCGVRIYGGVGRREKKKSLRLLFKSMYGASKLRYPLFGDEATDEFDTIILRANFNDGYPWGGADSQFIRDEWMRRMQLLLGHPSATGSFVHLYINGLYWGLYNPVQRPDTAFSASYYGGDKEEWDGVNSGQSVNSSPRDAWYALMSMCDGSLAGNEAYQRLQGNNPDGTDNPDYEDYLDVDQYIDFLIVNFWGGNNDWISHNWYAGRRRGPLSTGWKSYTWDAEWVIGMRSGVNENSVNDTTTSNYLLKPYTYLRQNPEFRLLFADHVHKAFFNDGPLYTDPSNPAWDPEQPQRNRPAALYAGLAEAIEHAVICETARWGDVAGGSPHTLETWRTRRDWVLNTYMPQRSPIVLSQLRSAGLYPNVDAPVFYVNSSQQQGGHISAADLVSMGPQTATIYYTTDGTDPRDPVTSEISGTTLVSRSTAKRVLVPTGPVSDNWRGGEPFDDAGWHVVSGSPGGVGYDERPDYDPFISYDVEALMNGDLNPNANTSALLRVRFDLDAQDLQDFNFMTLNVQYDDAFVAYINGQEVARANFTGQPEWDSRAGAGHEAASVFESFDISDRLAALKAGQNILTPSLSPARPALTAVTPLRQRPSTPGPSRSIRALTSRPGPRPESPGAR